MKTTLLASLAALASAVFLFIGVVNAQTPSPTPSPTPTPATDDTPAGAPNTGYGMTCEH